MALLQTVEREEQLLGTQKSSPVSASFPLASLFSQTNLPSVFCSAFCPKSSPSVCFPSLFGPVSSLSVTAQLLSSSPLLFPFFFFCFARASLPSKQTLPLLSYLSLCPSLIVLPWCCSLPCIYRQPGERFTIPCPSAGHGGVGVAGYGCVGVGMGYAGFLGKWGGEREGKNSGKSFKNPLLPCLCICRGEKAAQCRSKRHRAVFFFF